ncbi:MAG TPA: thiamine pyrophosphate-dependent dehydrogenase E1 component subunit alpha, partial [Balneolaceae bacterium]|nr:thiamine pyrophosphate-dependent dehydrogenase E1 component subunit alpha [Balneolaceae bacterium]
MIQSKKKLNKKQAIQTYHNLLLPRRIEERMLKLLRQNRISKWFSGMGQEAIAVGVATALDERDYLLPMHRNLGVFTTRGVDLYKLFCQLLGKADGFSGGRERSFHFGVPEKHIVGMISHLAATMPVADGLALASKLRGSDFVACSFCGDGATSEGEFHEAMNLAAVWQLPVIFMIENNGYGLSTPTNEQFACENLVDRAQGYGMRGVQIDGNDIF